MPPDRRDLRGLRLARIYSTTTIQKNQVGIELVTLWSEGTDSSLCGKKEFEANMSPYTLALSTESDIIWSFLRRDGVDTVDRSVLLCDKTVRF